MPPTVAFLFSAVWLLVLGGCVGSFLNVVVYRLPAGLSIVHPGSHCPACGHAVRAYDNIPVVSWLALRGHCRDCGKPISLRYPLVEALVGTVFVLLAWAGPLRDGANLPATLPALPLTADLSWGMFGVHVLLVCTLISTALIQYDGKPVLWTLFVPAILAGLVWQAYWWELRTWPHSTANVPQGWLAAVVHGTLSALSGACFGGLTCLGLPRTLRSGTTCVTNLMAGAACGVSLGWQAAAAVTAAATVLFLMTIPASRVVSAGLVIPWSAYLTLAAALYIMNWRAVTERFAWLGDHADGRTWLGLAALVLVASLLTKAVATPGRLSRGDGA